MIFETVVYDGGMKQFRVLNLMSGTFYCVAYDTFEAARQTIVDGEERAGYVVRYVSLKHINNVLSLDILGADIDSAFDHQAVAERSRRTCEMLHEEERRIAERKVKGDAS